MRQLKAVSCVVGLVLVTSTAPARADEVTPFAPVIDSRLLDDAPAGDGRRTLGRFGANLGRNLVGVFGKDSLKPLAISMALVGVGTALDHRTQGFFEGHRRAPRLGSMGQSFGSVAVMAPALGVLLTASRGTHDTRLRAASYDMAQATLLTQVYTGALKHAVGRTRPDGSDRLSFPSGHTSNAFALATVARHHYGTRTGVFAYGAAALVGISRMERNAHHLSDVVAGAAIGVLVGRTVVRLNGEPSSRRASVSGTWAGPGMPAPASASQGRQLMLVPATDARGGGVGLGVSLSF